jgi:Zn-finger in ubiquitin-hydrolases and other protein
MDEPLLGIDPTVPPSGPGCNECDEAGGWWFHLRRCAQCGHIGCCDSSPSQHASAHADATGHRSFAATSRARTGSGTIAVDRRCGARRWRHPSTIRLTSRSPARPGGCLLTGNIGCTDAHCGTRARCRAGARLWPVMNQTTTSRWFGSAGLDQI